MHFYTHISIKKRQKNQSKSYKCYICNKWSKKTQKIVFSGAQKRKKTAFLGAQKCKIFISIQKISKLPAGLTFRKLSQASAASALYV